MENYPNVGSHVGVYGNNYSNATDKNGNLKFGWAWDRDNQSWVDVSKTHGRRYKIEANKGLNKLLNGKGKSHVSYDKLEQRYNATSPIDRLKLTAKEASKDISDRWHQGHSQKRRRLWLPYDLDMYVREIAGNKVDTYKKPTVYRKMLSFKEAKAIVRAQGLLNSKEWYQWSKTDRPYNIPGHPRTYYKGRGWKGMKDWLGTERK